ncbi:SDR family NAD(P)-dependent oxidoreductase [Sphingobacteriales bacterium UPWRP_1]|nr:hypothetical protein BVG80_14245 [Sphingobacteriales bacterium TSM_CSM]PSJ77032.1 SDR family NAD(P)-dependent oxidoreductase [Sphingobacteriales bacterium UPWRP_1]
MQQQTAPTVLITGGSSGIGFELAQLFARDGYRLIIVSKPAEELEKAKTHLLLHFPQTQVITIQKDLTLPGSATEVFNAVTTAGLQPDVLVNNAGFGSFGFFTETSMELEHNMILLNCNAMFELTKLFLPAMVARRKGRILNVASVAAMQPNPMFAVYGATKAFVLSMSRALNFELKEQKTNITVTTLCPPPTRTNFKNAAGMHHTAIFNHFDALDATTVARHGYKGMLKGREVVIPGGYIGFLYRLVGVLLPTWLLMRIAYFKLNMKASG